jgi:hypothetical protein
VTNIFTSEEVATLSSEIDSQLRELRAGYDSGMKNLESETPESLPAKQSQAIEEITQENPKSFLKKFGRAAKSDLCEEGGLLNNQWKKWADLNNKDVIDKFGLLLVAMGFSGAGLEILVVAVAVIVIHIGVKAFCEDYSQ